MCRQGSFPVWALRLTLEVVRALASSSGYPEEGWQSDGPSEEGEVEEGSSRSRFASERGTASGAED